MADADRHTVVARRQNGYEHELQVGEHRLTSDEPVEAGGTDKGPTPVGLLTAALGSCTATTIEMYADRKGWELGPLVVQTRVEMDGYLPASFRIGLNLPAELTEEQVSKLLVIAGRCPVHRSLSDGIEVEIVPGSLEG